MKIEHKTLTDRAYDAIRTGLITSQFAPGQVLVIRSLADIYGISATPVREALHRLVGERLLTMLPSRSIVVPELTLALFDELTAIRAALEGLCAARATTKIRPMHIKRLHGLVDRLQTAIDGRDVHTYVALNQQLHFTIYEQADSTLLLEMIQGLWSQVGPFLKTLFDSEPYIGTANDEHRHIVAALEEGDPEVVRQAVARDIMHAAHALGGALTRPVGRVPRPSKPVDAARRERSLSGIKIG